MPCKKVIISCKKTASELKADWMRMDVESFEPRTFREIKIDQRFIPLPEPGDNQGHGGFRNAYYVFTKTHNRAYDDYRSLHFAITHGKAVNSRGVAEYISNDMNVILVE